ncbi:MAG: hypothetical protein WCE68_00860 [Anaerolineales bacterium]
MKTTSDTTKAQNGLHGNAIFMIGGLVIQYALGMLANLFVQFPNTTRADLLWAFARTQFPTLAHIVVGTILLAGAILLAVRAARQKDRLWIVSSVAGLVSILAAIFGGTQFVTSQLNAYSLVMALATILAFLSYGWGLYASRR